MEFIDQFSNAVPRNHLEMNVFTRGIILVRDEWMGRLQR